MARTFNIKRGDTSPALRFALEPATINLLGATVAFQMRARRGVILVDAAAVIDTATPPILRYDWASGDTTRAGIYEGEFRVTYSDGSVETFPNRGFISININEDVR
jgi:hypothetical protein